jgi:multidrug efflux pump subunit AcrA (membrane-fusion protein)
MKSKKILLTFCTLVALILIGAVWHYNTGGVFSHAGDDQQMNGIGRMEGMGEEDSTQAAAMISPSRRQLIGVKTAVVEKQIMEATIRAVGTIDYDERHIRLVTLRSSGWITKMFANFTGQSVKKGDPLFSLYSPDLVAAEEEHLLAYHRWGQTQGGPVAMRTFALTQVTRNRLLLLNLTDAQIDTLEKREKPQTEMTIYSPIDGIITKKMAIEGMYVAPEMSLYEIADLSTVWVYTHIYEYELSEVAV